MSFITPTLNWLLPAALPGKPVIGGCSVNEPPAALVRAFCDGIRVGEPFTDVEAHYSAFQLQPGGFARDLGERLGGRLPAQERHKTSSARLRIGN